VAANEQDDILHRVRDARAEAEIVVVSLHSHEPTNTSEQPADFVEKFARAAIDAGAHLVVGHGPHRLRGVERYKDGLIFYSLGNFIYQAESLDFRAADMFDAGTDLYAFMAGAARAETGDSRVPQDPAWWESAVAEVTLDGGRITAARLHAIVIDRPGGTPRLAPPDRAADILARLSRLSTAYKTALRIEDGAAVIAPAPGGT
jgi:poly-gamma-glutamate synthesis protein (capsule biosynthesis protein)